MYYNVMNKDPHIQYFIIYEQTHSLIFKTVLY